MAKVAMALSIVICILAFCGFSETLSLKGDPFFENRIAKGTSLRQQGAFDQALAEFDEILQLTKIRKDNRAQLECLMNLGILHWNIGKVKESDEIFRQALALSRELGLDEQAILCASHIKIFESYVRGKEAFALGLHQESIAQFRTAIHLSRKIGSPEHELKCLRQMSLNYHQLEAYSDFSLLNQEGLMIAKEINHKKEEGRFLNNIGLYYLLVCDYSKALAFFTEALSIFRTLGCKEQDTSECLNNIGLAHSYLGNYDKALLYLEEALEIDYRAKDELAISGDLNNIGTTYSRKGRALKSKNELYASFDYYRQSLEYTKNTLNKHSSVEILNNIGLVCNSLGYHTSAMMYFSTAIQEADSIDYDYEGCNVHVNMGFALLAIKKYRESIEHFNKALELAIEVRRNEIVWEAYFGLGQCLENYGRCSSALACYGKAIDTIDQMRSRLVLDVYKAGFSREKMKAYESLLNLFWNLKEKEETSKYDPRIFEVVEKARARAFLEELGKVDCETSDLGNIKTRNEQLVLSKKISFTISELIRPNLEDTQRQKLMTRLQVEEDEYTNLLNRIKIERAENSSAAPPEVMSADKIRERYLDGRTAFLEYYLGEKKSFGILISRDHFILKVLPSRANIEDSLRAFLKMISTPPDRKFQGVLAGQRIYKELVYPFEEGLSRSIEHLIFVPDGILHHLPFEVLVRDDSKKAGPRHLVELFDISYATSISSFAYLVDKDQKQDSKKMLLAVGNPVYFPPNSRIFKRRDGHKNALREIYLNEGFELSSLPHSKREVRRIAGYFRGNKVDVLLEAEAKEENIKSRSLEDYRIIHFACHGFLDEKTPMRSALVLSLDDSPDEDGFLQAREISNLRLNADLVVLSACQTGKGRLESAEGVLGLPRSFFYAGARSTISSLWKINDKSTSRIMPDFYRYLAQGHNKARSLRLAKLRMLKSRFSHPFHWAAFVLNGDHRLAGL